MTVEDKRIGHLVVDSGGFIKNAPIERLCANAYTIPEVVAEIRDKQTKARLKILPYELKFRDPSQEAINKVSEAAKLSGDIASLSAVDIKVLALTYQLSKELAPEKELKEDLSSVETKEQIGADPAVDEAKKIRGFYEGDSSEDEDDGEGEWTTPDNVDDDSEDDNDDDWITPFNIDDVPEEVEEPDFVACLTTDFAMQNVLLRMKIGMVGVEGRKIKNARKYILRCTGCKYIDKTCTKVFCPGCGHKTMRRVACEVLEDGNIKLFLAKDPKCLKSRGTVYNLPKPQGGKYAKNPVLTDLQPMPQQRVSKKTMMRNNIMASDLDAMESPFHFNDTESKGYRLGFGQRNRHFKNPNASRPRGKKK
ncbi:Oidioi.mRNA.OKI2018_I69.PAR.g11735.t1.cds [Oikopleura dioica]|uniref:Oidioi.mRNA.OKI2018_I69.PAR.g11735.t1.cds n=1 Tax=Oikopleura dioica TaxID=34765 RepID=A0ABN7S0F2_OIKDI|nr:Oidioi.mRNA.OKI2018_I69.PAR.g11735.t1.cds [Oikopleura dioica]